MNGLSDCFNDKDVKQESSDDVYQESYAKDSFEVVHKDIQNAIDSLMKADKLRLAEKFDSAIKELKRTDALIQVAYKKVYNISDPTSFNDKVSDKFSASTIRHQTKMSKTKIRFIPIPNTPFGSFISLGYKTVNAPKELSKGNAPKIVVNIVRYLTALAKDGRLIYDKCQNRDSSNITKFSVSKYLRMNGVFNTRLFRKNYKDFKKNINESVEGFIDDILGSL